MSYSRAASHRAAWGCALIAGMLTLFAPVSWLVHEGAVLALGVISAAFGGLGTVLALRVRDLRLAVLNAALGSIVLLAVAILLTIAGGP